MLQRDAILTVSAGGEALGTSFDEFAIIEVHKGGVIADTVIDSENGGQIYLGSGAKASATTIGGYADFFINHGAVAAGTNVSSGGSAVVGGTENGGIVFSGGVMSVSYGKAKGVVVSSGGVMSVTSKGKAGNSTVASGGLEMVSAGSKATGTKVASGGYVIDTGGSATGSKIAAGGHVVSAGVALVSAGGGVTLFSKTASQNFDQGSDEYVLNGGIESGTNSVGGQMFVYKGGSAVDTTLTTGGLTVYSGGRATQATLASHGFIAISGGVGSNISATGGGTIEVVSGGMTYDSYVSDDSYETINFGGIANEAKCAAGGVLLLQPPQSRSRGAGLATAANGGGGTASGVNVYAGGEIGNFNRSVKTTLSGGTEILFGGVSSETVVSSGGHESVTSGGVSYNAVVSAGGTEIVGTLGTASATTIAGGTLNVAASGTIDGTVTFAGSGGSLVISAATLPANTISGFAAGDSIQLAGIAYVTGATVAVKTANAVQIMDGGKTYMLQIAGAAVGETDFHFSSGSLLTKGTAPAMSFLRPPEASAADDWAPYATAAPAGETAVTATSLAVISASRPYAAMPSLVASPSHPVTYVHRN